ncbi:uncharacterized protein LOC124163029 [Ischnura elegans]|uniref:uncharacterized protein LOC124163029 n=1 Tax=Ischnura elegans TaxID=197161 RepID=UPI001ED8A2DF|nr:uncharacterized protein LOC124163029 [Ischnura elegans]
MMGGYCNGPNPLLKGTLSSVERDRLREKERQARAQMSSQAAEEPDIRHILNLPPELSPQSAVIPVAGAVPVGGGAAVGGAGVGGGSGMPLFAAPVRSLVSDDGSKSRNAS